MKPPVLDYTPEAIESLQTQVLGALEDGANQVVLDLDTVNVLDSANVRDLIALLRRSRAVGGDIALRSSKPDVLTTLRVTALDKIFSIAQAAA